MKYLLLLIFTCLTILVGCQSVPETPKVTARVERVLSGQAIEVTLLNSSGSPTSANQQTRQQVRLQGIDAPDRRQDPWGAMAQEQLTALITDNNPDRLVQLELQELKPDQFDRLVAPVWHNGVLINLELVKAGFALAQLPRDGEEPSSATNLPSNLPNNPQVNSQTNLSAPTNPHQAALMQAQAQARILGIGIWDPSQPMRLTPSEFRRYNQNSP
ncbi:MAG: thermonuclease family protein [Coleofasciculaceae cyanobacterium SM2_1_6]|nr:thermonuclease family protein [Coleofasciculaceae cyanobacterium SM2_1_6]